MILGDNLAVVSAFTKERSSSAALQAPCQRAAAYELAATSTYTTAGYPPT